LYQENIISWLVFSEQEFYNFGYVCYLASIFNHVTQESDLREKGGKKKNRKERKINEEEES